MPAALGTRVRLAAGALLFYFLATGLTYRLRSSADERLTRDFERGLGTLAMLAPLQEDLGEIDNRADRYLLTGEPRWLAEREGALARARGAIAALAKQSPADPDEALLVGELDRALKSELAEQNLWLARKRAGGLSPAEAVRLAGRARPYGRLVRLLAELQSRSLGALQSRRQASQRQAAAALWLFLAGGALLAAVLARILSRAVLEPLAALERHAREWRAGVPWDLELSGEGPEIASLHRCLRELSGRAAAQLERESELARLKTQLVSLISHDVNNALNLIQGITTLLEETEGEAAHAARRTEYYAMIRANIRALAEESVTLLHMAKLESTAFALRPRPVDAAGLAREALERLRILYERKGQEVLLEPGGRPVLVQADPDGLALVLTNLLTNAIKYTPKGGRIRVGARAEDGAGSAVLSVADTGIGMSPDEVERALSGFYRTERSKNVARGFGVGLSLVKRVVEAHDSRLEIESAPGRGTTFRFRLRTAEPAA